MGHKKRNVDQLVVTRANTRGAYSYRTTALIPATSELAVRRMAARVHLDAFLASGVNRHLYRFVTLCGEGGTFPDDFDGEAHIPNVERPSHRRQCIVCHKRAPLAEFVVLDAKKRKRIGKHGWSCRSCQEAQANRWHRQPQTRIPRPALALYSRVCIDCGRDFETAYANALYCSDTCRWRTKQARHRDRKLVA